MTPRNAIAQMAKTIGRELQSGARPSESAWAAGPMLANAGATKEIAACLCAEARRKRPSDRLLSGGAFLLERALDTLRLRANGGDVGAGRAIDEVRKGIEQALVKDGATPEVLVMIARAFAQAELDPGRALQEAVVSAMEAQSAAMPLGPEPEGIGDPFDAIAESLGNDPFTLYAEFATTGAAFPAEHRAAMASAFAMSNRAVVREAALGFACAADPTTSAAALRALAQPPRGRPVSSAMVVGLTRLGGLPDAFARGVRLCPRHAHPIQPSSDGRWSIWSAPDVTGLTWPESSSPRRRRSGGLKRRPVHSASISAYCGSVASFRSATSAARTSGAVPPSRGRPPPPRRPLPCTGQP